MKKQTMLQKAQAIHQTAMVTQTPLTGILIKTMGFSTLRMLLIKSMLIAQKATSATTL